LSKNENIAINVGLRTGHIRLQIFVKKQNGVCVMVNRNNWVWSVEVDIQWANSRNCIDNEL